MIAARDVYAHVLNHGYESKVSEWYEAFPRKGRQMRPSGEKFLGSGYRNVMLCRLFYSAVRLLKTCRLFVIAPLCVVDTTKAVLQFRTSLGCYRGSCEEMSWCLVYSVQVAKRCPAYLLASGLLQDTVSDRKWGGFARCACSSHPLGRWKDIHAPRGRYVALLHSAFQLLQTSALH